MNLNSPSSDYLTYKKSKMNPNRVQRVEKRIEKAKRVVKLSLLTFCVMFLCVVVFIKKYAKRIDIEYGRHGLSNVEKSSEQPFSEAYDPDKRLIDKRLTLIQEEENAPSESRVLDKDRDKNEVMNFEQYELLRSNVIEEDEKEKEKKEDKKEEEKQPQPVQKQPQAQTNPQPELLPKKTTTDTPLKVTPKGDYTPSALAQPSTIKVLSGKYATYEEAKNAQLTIKSKVANAPVPFIRKIGSTYSLQIGSFSNMEVARNVAGNYSTMGVDVWIYQQ